MIGGQVIHDIDLSDRFGIHCVKLTKTTNDHIIISMNERFHIELEEGTDIHLDDSTKESVKYFMGFLKKMNLTFVCLSFCGNPKRFTKRSLKSWQHT